MMILMDFWIIFGMVMLAIFFITIYSLFVGGLYILWHADITDTENFPAWYRNFVAGMTGMGFWFSSMCTVSVIQQYILNIQPEVSVGFSVAEAYIFFLIFVFGSMFVSGIVGYNIALWVNHRFHVV
jgi:hypothetical protein